MMCRRCGLSPATLDAVGETGQNADYCMECWLRGCYSLVGELLEEPEKFEEPEKSSDLVISKAVWRLVGGILIALAFVSAYCWAGGAERFSSQGDAPNPLHWVWILALGALGRLLQLLGREENPQEDFDDEERDYL